jgi:uncharacterized protein (UPF0335 family)
MAIRQAVICFLVLLSVGCGETANQVTKSAKVNPAPVAREDLRWLTSLLGHPDAKLLSNRRIVELSGLLPRNPDLTKSFSAAQVEEELEELRTKRDQISQLTSFEREGVGFEKDALNNIVNRIGRLEQEKEWATLSSDLYHREIQCSCPSYLFDDGGMQLVIEDDEFGSRTEAGLLDRPGTMPLEIDVRKFDVLRISGITRTMIPMSLQEAKSLNSKYGIPDSSGIQVRCFVVGRCTYGKQDLRTGMDLWVGINEMRSGVARNEVGITIDKLIVVSPGNEVLFSTGE